MLDALVSILPAKLQDKAKALVVALGTIVGIVVTVWPNAPEWLSVVVAVLTALGVYAVPNVAYDAKHDGE